MDWPTLWFTDDGVRCRLAVEPVREKVSDRAFRFSSCELTYARKAKEGEAMKRTPELRTLSEDHHYGLVHARRLRRAAEGEEANSAEPVAKEFLDFWQEEIAIHFRKEEEVLLPVVARYGGDVGQDPLVEMLAQHARIRGLVMRLSDEVVGGYVRLETLQELGEQLEAHIRLEERAVFPLVEESLSEAALTELAARLEVKEAGPRVEPWVPAEELSYAPWPGPGDSEGGGYD
jgi:hemerythrin-like domain-containing protein